MEQTAGLGLGDELCFRRVDHRADFVSGLVDGADAELDPQPVVEKFPDPRPRQPKAQVERHDQGGQTRPHQAPFLHRHRTEFGGDVTLGRLGTAVVTTGTGHLKIAVINDVQPQTRCRWIALVEVEGLKAGVAHRGGRGHEGLTATGTYRGAMLLGVVGGEDLGPSDTGGPYLLARPALLGLAVSRASRRAGGGVVVGVSAGRASAGGAGASGAVSSGAG